MKSREKCEFSKPPPPPVFVLRRRGLSSGSGVVGEIKKAPIWILIISGICDNTTIKWACEDLWKWPFWNSRDNEFWYVSRRAPSSSSLHVHLNVKLTSALEDSGCTSPDLSVRPHQSSSYLPKHLGLMQTTGGMFSKFVSAFLASDHSEVRLLFLYLFSNYPHKFVPIWSTVCPSASAVV